MSEKQTANPVGPTEKIDVSVILPCYNVEDYLEQAISSAEQNDRISLEIICVNDGSKDSSLKIMLAHAERDPRVRVIDKENQGYGASMNRGISEARGTYIAILEPDDWVDPHMYDDLFEYGQSFVGKTESVSADGPDVIKTPYWRVWMPETKYQKFYNCAYYLRTAPDHQPFTLVDAPRMIQHHPSIWSALYRREFLSEYDIHFMEVPGAGWVDNPFLIETLAQAKSIVYLDKPYYRYREDLPGSSSALRSVTLPIERWHNMCDVLDRLEVYDLPIRQSLGVIAFRYTAGLMKFDNALEDPEIKELAASMFKRMGSKLIISIPNVAPSFKNFALELAGEVPARISDKTYVQALVREFFYTWKSNSLEFALSRVGMFLDERGIIHYNDNPLKTNSASI